MSKPLSIPAVLLLSLTMALAGCGRDTRQSAEPGEDCVPAKTFSTITDGELRVAATDLPPFSAIDGTVPTQVDGQLIMEFAEQNCLKVVAQPYTYSNAIPALQSNRVDVVIGAWNRTAERAKVVALSAPVYLDQMGLISSERITTIDQLVGKKVGTPDGYLWVDDLKRLLGDDLQLYDTNVDVKNDLEAGRIEVAADSYGAAVKLFDGGEYVVSIPEGDPRVAASTEPAQVGFPVSKSSPSLLSALDAAIQEFHADGLIKEILRKNGLDESAAETGQPRLID